MKTGREEESAKRVKVIYKKDSGYDFIRVIKFLQN